MLMLMSGTYITRQDRLTAVRTRDPAAGDAFVYAVASTGVYCRADCASRQALEANIAFFDSGAAARAAGYRPCQRCQPDVVRRPSQPIEQAIALIQDADVLPSVNALAQAVGLSRAHFCRQFKTVTGVSPRAYRQQLRSQRARTSIKTEPSVTAAIYGAGFDSSSRFYAQAERIYGMTPRVFRHGGAGLTMAYGLADSPLGRVLVAWTSRGICMIGLDDADAPLVDDLHVRFPAAAIAPAAADHTQMLAAVVGAIETPAKGRDLPLDVQGTAFQQRVWQALRAIPLGQTRSYGALAADLGVPTGARAVATACAANPISVLIPCHRVVGRNGALTGYRWGVARKRALLAQEAQLADGTEPSAAQSGVVRNARPAKDVL